MGQSLPGTVIAAEITTGDTDNTFSIGDTNLMKGGLHQVIDLNARDAITTARRAEGMLCYVAYNDPDPSASLNPSDVGPAMYQLIGGTTNDHWVQVFLSTSSEGIAGSGEAGSSGTSGTSGTALVLNATDDNRLVKTVFNDPSAGEDGELQQTGVRIDDDNNLILLAGTKLILDG